MEVVERIAQVLGGPTVLHRPVRTWGDLDRIVQAGLPKRSLQLVARRAVQPGASVTAFVNRVGFHQRHSGVPPATFKRRSKLSLDESQRTERLARVVALTEALWEDERETKAFLNRPHSLLEGKTPLEVARTELGARRVERLLHDVEQGLPL